MAGQRTSFKLSAEVYPPSAFQHKNLAGIRRSRLGSLSTRARLAYASYCAHTRASAHTHTHTHTHARTHAHTRTHTRTHTHAHTHSHTHVMHACIYIYLKLVIHTAHANTHTRTHTRARARARTCTHTHTHARTHARTHTRNTRAAPSRSVSGARRLLNLGFQLNFCAGMRSADRPRWIT